MSKFSITDLTVNALIGKKIVLQNDENGNPVYIGEAEPGTAKSSTGWRIKKLVWSGENLTDILWTGGSQKFEFIWDNRLSYNYS